MRDIPEKITEPMWWSMCDANMSLPVPLAKADLCQPFLYCREWGVFYVAPGYHQLAMSTLFAFQMGLTKAIHAAEKLGMKSFSGTADRWLDNTPGAALRSSQGKAIHVGRPDALTVVERRIFSRAPGGYL